MPIGCPRRRSAGKSSRPKTRPRHCRAARPSDNNRACGRGRRRRVCSVRIHVLIVAVCMRELLRRDTLPADLCHAQARTAFGRGKARRNSRRRCRGAAKSCAMSSWTGPHRTYRFRRGSFRSRGPAMKISARLYLRSGVAPAPHDARDAAINEAFAEANAVRPGADVRVLLNQRMQGFHITGIALSPEYVYAVKPGLPIPDDRYYAIL